MLDYENQAKQNGYRLVIGVDEAGRGPLAGPVVAAAVAIKEFNFSNRIADSKKLTPLQRERSFKEILEKSFVGVGVISASVIDSKNILNATHHAMTIAVHHLINRLPVSLTEEKDFNKQVCVLIDGNLFRSDLPYDRRTIIQGDQKSLSIASASIVAKVTRDRILNTYDHVYPQYGFRSHKGYPTVKHKQAIKEHGLSIIHRKTFNHV